MRDDMTVNTTIKRQGNSWVLPLTVKDKEILGIEPGDDLEVKIIVRERKHREEEE